LLGIGDNYFSHGARDSAWNIAIRKLVIHKYDTSFSIIVSDTLGWPGQDNYPFIHKSIDYRNNEIMVGGHLDGPYNGFYFHSRIKKFYLAKYDEDLNQIWYTEYGGDRAYVFFGVQLLDDGGSLAYGYIIDTLDGNRYAYIMHVDKNGEILTSTTMPGEPASSVQLVNPGDEFLRILNPDHIRARIILYDLQGKPVLTGEIDSGMTEISARDLPAGLYPYVLIRDGHTIGVGKWIKGI
jgi:hypothetical protein